MTYCNQVIACRSDPKDDREKKPFEMLASITLKTVIKRYRICTELYKKAVMEYTMIPYFLLKE